jgi:PleD family two-component response regulator
MLKKYAEKDQFAARFGGEEMVMIVFGKSNIEIINASNKIRLELTESRLKLKKMTA